MSRKEKMNNKAYKTKIDFINLNKQIFFLIPDKIRMNRRKTFAYLLNYLNIYI
jgi:hypothetical protein